MELTLEECPEIHPHPIPVELLRTFWQTLVRQTGSINLGFYLTPSLAGHKNNR